MNTPRWQIVSGSEGKATAFIQSSKTHISVWLSRPLLIVCSCNDVAPYIILLLSDVIFSDRVVQLHNISQLS